ncbi:hypothetical protein CAPTEDRAFT_195614 [Capitella teleta]|uniref:Uncharacterized protein n=1 Tax=Capitella teleta TaxID=283909 RepID=R7TYP5_CAPTE|nr:hypothetical protein CAPTEDRAFT_195614 [Capitella teleta]|eukprot:ELT96090.1 hypothetical protein CAPTEDRAFT_195614 [Capitella teleta]
MPDALLSFCQWMNPHMDPSQYPQIISHMYLMYTHKHGFFILLTTIERVKLSQTESQDMVSSSLLTLKERSIVVEHLSNSESTKKSTMKDACLTVYMVDKSVPCLEKEHATHVPGSHVNWVDLKGLSEFMQGINTGAIAEALNWLFMCTTECMIWRFNNVRKSKIPHSVMPTDNVRLKPTASSYCERLSRAENSLKGDECEISFMRTAERSAHSTAQIVNNRRITFATSPQSEIEREKKARF